MGLAEPSEVPPFGVLVSTTVPGTPTDPFWGGAYAARSFPWFDAQGTPLTVTATRRELTIDDVTGGTFTITDLSGEGVVHFVPVLNERQSAILGLCAARNDGSRELVLTFDHRLSDGMRAARFLAALRSRLEAGLG